ncbi:hypothetical protein, partial [Haemophilus sp. SZY H54]
RRQGADCPPTPRKHKVVRVQSQIRIDLNQIEKNFDQTPPRCSSMYWGANPKKSSHQTKSIKRNPRNTGKGGKRKNEHEINPIYGFVRLEEKSFGRKKELTTKNELIQVESKIISRRGRTRQISGDEKPKREEHKTQDTIRFDFSRNSSTRGDNEITVSFPQK